MVDPLLAKGGVALAKVTLGRVLALWKSHADRSTEAIREAEAADGRRWRVERDHQVEQRLRELEKDAEVQREFGESLGKILEDLLNDPQFFRLSRNYELEAAREVTDDRRRMLAFASAWSVDPGMPIGELARTERTIRELDPPDVRALAKFQKIERPTGLKEFQIIGTDPLMASGCVQIVTSGGAGARPEAHITGLGYQVLRVLDGYVRSTAADDARKESK